MKKQRLYDAQTYEVLAAVYAREGCAVRGEDVGAYRTKLVRAGEYLYVSCYPLITSGARKAQEERLGELREELSRGKRSKLRVRWNRYNNERRVRDLEILAQANFPAGSLHVSCTYAFENWELGGPGEGISREDARRDIRNYLHRVKRRLKRHGCDLEKFKWLCVTVTRESLKEAANPRPDTHHHHLLMAGVPEELRGDIERMWGLGYCNADRVQEDGKSGVARIAGYVARQEGSANGERAGEKSFTCSRNVKRPAPKTSDARISCRRACRIAADVRANGREIFEKVWPGYLLTEDPKVYVSDFVAGAYIYARLRRREEGRVSGISGRRAREGRHSE